MRLGLSRTRNRNLKGVGIFFTLFFLIFLIWLIFTKLQPFFIEYAKVYSNNIANEVVNSAVDDVFVKEEYQSLAKIMENSSENIKAIETDTAKVNRLKSAMRSSRRIYQFIVSSCASTIFAMAVAQLPPPIMAILPGSFIS